MSKRENTDTGFGLIEVVVSMLILALVAVVLAPVLIQALLVMVNNSRLAMANQLANLQIDEMKASVNTCSSLLTLVNDAPARIATGPDGIDLQAHVYAADWTDCFSVPYPATYPVIILVNRADTGDVVSSAVSLIAVDGD